MRSVTLVAGPPCSGKSRHVDEHAGAGDVVVCHDREARHAGSRRRHEHLQVHRNAAEGRWSALVAEVAAAPAVTAWVIRCAPEGDERQRLAEQLRASEVLVLVPPLQVCLHRADLDNRSPRTRGLIRGWFDRYTPAPCDRLIGPDTRASRAW